MTRSKFLGCGVLAVSMAVLPACAMRQERLAGERAQNDAALAEQPDVVTEAELEARGIKPAVLTRGMPPIYPRRARNVGLEGEVLMVVKILENGRAVGARILRSSSPLFDEAAVACVKKWRFDPATKKGKPVAVWYEATVRFTIR